jgi:hypothetical protein
MTLLRVNFPETEFVPLLTWRKAEVTMGVKIAAPMPEVEWESDASGNTCGRNSELSCYACVPRKRSRPGAARSVKILQRGDAVMELR